MEKLKQLREERGLSQVKLAARADLNPATVNQIERGARVASPSTIRKLADALEVSIYDLMGLDAASVLQHHLTLIEEAKEAREAGNQERLSEIHKRMAEEVTSALNRLGPLQESEASKKRRERQAERSIDEAAAEAG